MYPATTSGWPSAIRPQPRSKKACGGLAQFIGRLPADASSGRHPCRVSRRREALCRYGASGGKLPRSDDRARRIPDFVGARSEEHTSELQSLMRISYAVFCLKKKKEHHKNVQNKKMYK